LSTMLTRAASLRVIASPLAAPQATVLPARPYIGLPAQPQSPARRLPIAKSANRLARRQATEQLARGHCEPGMSPIGRDLGQRGEHETALVEARMRQRQALGRDLAALVIEQIEVEGPGGVRHAASAPEAGFERQQRAEQRGRAQPGLDD